MNFNNQWLLDDYERTQPRTGRAAHLHRAGRALREVVQIVFVALLMYLGLNILVPRFEVEGHSMEPSFYTDERVVVSRLHYLVDAPDRGDIIVFEHENGKNLIKRIIGLPGETITMKDGQVFVDGAPLNETYVQALCQAYSCRDEQWRLGPDEYFVLGDNRNHSKDSHNFGPIHRDQIVGKVLMRYWPPENVSIFVDPDY